MPNVTSLEWRDLIGCGKQITFVTFDDGGILPIQSLYLKGDEHLDFFFSKFEDQIKMSARQMYQNAIAELIKRPENVYDVDFWKEHNMPSIIAIITFEVFRSFAPLSVLKLKDLKKKLGLEKLENLYKLASEIGWTLRQIGNSDNDPIYMSSQFANMDPSDQTLNFVKKSVDQFINSNVLINGIEYNWFPTSVEGRVVKTA